MLGLVLPFAVGALLLSVPARAGTVVVCAIAALQGIDPSWGSWLPIGVGGPLYPIAAGLSVRMLPGR